MKKFPLEPIEKASRKKLREVQLARLKWSLKRAYDKVPHYRKKFDAAGVKPKDGAQEGKLMPSHDQRRSKTIRPGKIGHQRAECAIPYRLFLRVPAVRA